MKILTNSNQYDVRTSVANNGIFLEAQLSADGVNFTKPIQFLLDTGATGEAVAILPNGLIEELGLNLPPIGHGQAEQADGSPVSINVCQASLRFPSIPASSPIVLLEAPISILEGASPLISLAALSFLNVVIQNGTLKLLELNTRSFG